MARGFVRPLAAIEYRTRLSIKPITAFCRPLLPIAVYGYARMPVAMSPLDLLLEISFKNVNEMHNKHRLFPLMRDASLAHNLRKSITDCCFSLKVRVLSKAQLYIYISKQDDELIQNQLRTNGLFPQSSNIVLPPYILARQRYWRFFHTWHQVR